MDRLGLWILLLLTTQGFTLFGPGNNKLDASEENPRIEFHLEQGLPSIKNRDKFLNGRYANVSDDEAWQGILREVFTVWNNVPAAYIELGLSTDRSAENNPEDKRHSITKSAGMAATVAASAMPTMNSERKIIEDCDIQVNSNATDAEDLAFVLLHEIGHCLGLGHNHTDSAAVMSYSRTNKSLTLGLDDMAGIIHLYPTAASKGESSEFAPCGVVSLTSRSTSAPIWIVGLPAVLYVFSRRRNIPRKGQTLKDR